MNYICDACSKLFVTLYPGTVPEHYFRMLLDISSIRSEKVTQALYGYFVKGKTRIQVCNEHDVFQGYLSVKIREINLLNKKINELYELRFAFKINKDCPVRTT